MSFKKINSAVQNGNLEEVIEDLEEVIFQIIDSHRKFVDVTYSDIQLKDFKVLYDLEKTFVDTKLLKSPTLLKLQNDLLLVLGILSLKKSDFETSKEYLHKALANFEKSEDRKGLANCNLSLGDVNIVTGNKEKSLRYYETAMKLFDDVKLDDKMQARNHIAVWLGFAGEITLSIDYYEKSLAEALQHNEQRTQAAALHGLGWNHQTQGNLEQALGFFQQSLDLTLIIQKREFFDLDMWLYQQMGGIFQLRKEHDKAANYFRQSLDLSNKNGNIYASTWNYFYLVMLFLEKEALADVKDYLSEFEKFQIKEKENLTLEMMFELTKGIVLSKSKKSKDKNLARSKFLKVINSDIQFKKIKIYSVIYLSELLLDYLDEFPESNPSFKVTIKQLKLLSSELNEIAKHQVSTHLDAEVALIESKIAKQEFKLDKSMRLLNQAQKLASQKGLALIMDKISSEYEELFKRGETPFIILLYLLVSERSLTDISEFLAISKTATSKHLKLLSTLKLIITSQEKKVRSSNIKAKYYKLSSHALSLLEPLDLPILDMINQARVNPSLTNVKFDSLKFKLRMWNTYQKFLEDFIIYIEKRIIPGTQGFIDGSESDEADIEKILEDISKVDSVKMYQYSMNDDQYEKFLEYYSEFNKKVSDMIVDSKNDESTDKRQSVFTLFMPIDTLLKIRKLKKDNEI